MKKKHLTRKERQEQRHMIEADIKKNEYSQSALRMGIVMLKRKEARLEHH